MKTRKAKEEILYMDVVREDMKVAGVVEKDAEDREQWRRKICCGDP